MRRFPWRSVMPDEESQQTASPEDPVAVESSPARSYRSSTNSSIRGGGGKWFKSLEGSPSKSWGGMIDGVFGASGAGTSLGSGGVGTGGSETPMSNKKMLKIGANVRFRGDVMECNTLVLCGRLQGFVETQRLIVKKGGKFVGDAKVEDADVYGSFEGALESTSKVCVRSTGVITGTVVYKGMSMEDGGEVEGTLRCSNKPSRKQSREEAVETAEKAQSAGTGVNTALVASASNSEEQQAGHSGSAAGANSTAPASPAVVGEATPEPGSQPWPSASAALAAAAAGTAAAGAAAGPVPTTTGSTVPAVATSTGIGTASGGGGEGNPAAGVGPKSTSLPSISMSSIKWPPKQPGQGPGPAVVGTPRRGIPLPASSPSSRLRVAAPSPRKSPGLQQVQNLGPEAWEIFSAEEETSPGSITAAYAPPLAALEAVGKKVSRSSTEATSEAPVVLEGGVSVAALIGTWPPASPANSKAWNKRAESVSPASAASPSAAPPAAPTSMIAALPVLRKTFSEGIRPPTTAPAGRRHEGQIQNHNQMGLAPAPASAGADGLKRLVGPREGVGIGGGSVTSGLGGGNASGRGNAPGGAAVVAVSGGGTGSKGKGFSTCAGEGTGESEGGLGGSLEKGKNTAAASEETERKKKPLPPKKACESSNCGLEACWGDPRFRPRYCARHKKQGSKLMDPVELEEGDEAALPEGSSLFERVPPSEAPRRVVKGEAPTAAAAAGAGAGPGKAKADSEVVGSFGRAWNGGESDDDDDDDDDEDDEDEDEGWGNEGADPRVLNGTLGVGRRLSSDGDSVSGGENTSAPQQPPEQQQQPELELPPPQQPEPEPQQPNPEPQQPDPEPQQPDLEPQQPDAEPQQPDAEPQQPDLEPQQPDLEPQQQSQEQQNQEADRRIDDAPDVSGEGSVDGTGEVQAPEPAYGRLARAMPSIKSKPYKPKKRATGNNIADFYGGGEEEESDEETSFSMDVISKSARQSQGAEMGTHTDDGQPRPQASQERDKQRIMHLVRVNKIGTFRGKGVTAVGKRR
ncbi:unnamed protein product [Ascophyllum nodosum]